MMVNDVLICRKLDVLVSYYRELLQLTSELSQERYLNELATRRSVEREIQLIVECATDINGMILKSLGKGPAKDYFNSFLDIAEAGVIDISFALQIAPSTGLRNILVHEYQKVDDTIVFASIDEVKRYYKDYISEIAEYFDCNLPSDAL